MLGRTVLAFGLATTILALATVACVGDEEVDLNALKGSGAASSSGSGDAGPSSATAGEHPPVVGGPNRAGARCGLLASSQNPTCPTVAVGDDATCNVDAPICCPGETGTCVRKGQPCATKGPSFECFSAHQCGVGGACCINAVAAEVKDPDCSDTKTMLVPDSVGSSCLCGASSTHLCDPDPRLTGECPTGQVCRVVRFVVPNPTGKGDFVRHVGVCQ